MNSLQHRFEISLPEDWSAQLPETILRSDSEKMRFVLELADWNVRNDSGGPFAAAVFRCDNDELVSIGVNRVVPLNCSLAHAEAVALALAQQQLRTHDLSSAESGEYELFASGQPCVQCFGMVWWSGVSRLVIGARASDIEELTGFHEGPLPENWQQKLGNRLPQPAVKVTMDVEREQARQVLTRYAQLGGRNYGPGAV